MSSPWKDPRTGMYYIRRGVPETLQKALGHKTYKRSLGTKDPKQAKKLFLLSLQESDTLFAKTRHTLGTPERSEISSEEIRRLADA